MESFAKTEKKQKEYKKLLQSGEFSMAKLLRQPSEIQWRRGGGWPCARERLPPARNILRLASSRRRVGIGRRPGKTTGAGRRGTGRDGRVRQRTCGCMQIADASRGHARGMGGGGWAAALATSCRACMPPLFFKGSFPCPFPPLASPPHPSPFPRIDPEAKARTVYILYSLYYLKN